MRSFPIKIIIADDHTLIRQSMEMMFEAEKNFQLLGSAKDGRELMQMAVTLQPDVIIADIAMPVMSGLDVIKQLAATHPHLPVVAISFSPNPATIYNIIEAGAKGFILKSSPSFEIVEAAATAAAGGDIYYCSHTAPIIDAYLKQLKQDNGKAGTKPLTDKEKEIILHTCNEKTSKEIAIEMQLSPRTIEDIKQKILRKINASSGLGIIKYAIREKLYNIK